MFSRLGIRTASAACAAAVSSVPGAASAVGLDKKRMFEFVIQSLASFLSLKVLSLASFLQLKSLQRPQLDVVMWSNLISFLMSFELNCCKSLWVWSVSVGAWHRPPGEFSGGGGACSWFQHCYHVIMRPHC